MIIITSDKGQILYDAALVDQADDHLFEPEAWRMRGGLQPVSAGRGAAWFLDNGRHAMVLRHYRRGGLAARLCEDCYLWTGKEHTRPWREFMLLARLHGMGLPVPRPVAARVVRGGLFYRGDLITLRLDARPLSSLLASGEEASWDAIGRCLRRFHDAGVFHADLNAHNILLDANGQPFVIDFDRGRLLPDGAWRQRNLARLKHSLEKLQRQDTGFRFNAADWSGLEAGYAASP